MQASANSAVCTAAAGRFDAHLEIILENAEKREKEGKIPDEISGERKVHYDVIALRLLHSSSRNSQ